MKLFYTLYSENLIEKLEASHGTKFSTLKSIKFLGFIKKSHTKVEAKHAQVFMQERTGSSSSLGATVSLISAFVIVIIIAAGFIMKRRFSATDGKLNKLEEISISGDTTVTDCESLFSSIAKSIKSEKSHDNTTVMKKFFEVYENMLLANENSDKSPSSNNNQEEFNDDSNIYRSLHTEVFTIRGPRTKHTLIESLIIKFQIQEVTTVDHNNIIKISNEESFEMTPFFIDKNTKTSAVSVLNRLNVPLFNNNDYSSLLSHEHQLMSDISKKHAWDEYTKLMQKRQSFVDDESAAFFRRSDSTISSKSNKHTKRSLVNALSYFDEDEGVCATDLYPELFEEEKSNARCEQMNPYNAIDPRQGDAQMFQLLQNNQMGGYNATDPVFQYRSGTSNVTRSNFTNQIDVTNTPFENQIDTFNDANHNFLHQIDMPAVPSLAFANEMDIVSGANLNSGSQTGIHPNFTNQMGVPILSNSKFAGQLQYNQIYN